MDIQVHKGRQGVNEQIKLCIQDCGYRWAKHVWIFYEAWHLIYLHFEPCNGIIVVAS
jgi:hypothetical protein